MVDSIVQKFQEGLMFFSDGQYNDALAIFTSLIESEFSESEFSNEDKLFKIMAYKSIASIYNIKNNYQNAIKYSKLAFKFYEDTGNNEEKVNSLLSIGNLYADADNLEETINYYNTAIEVYDSDKQDVKNSQLEKAITLIDLAVILLEKDETQKAIKYFKLSLAIYEKYDKVSNKISTLIDIGNIFLAKNDLKNTLKYFEDAISLYKEIPKQKAKQLIEIGKILFENNEYDRGLEYLERGLRITSKASLSDELVNIGSFLDKISEFDYAIDYFERAEKLFENDKKSKTAVLSQLGNIYSKLGQIERSIAYFEKQIEINEELDDIHDKAIGLLGLGSVLANKGLLNKALDYFNQSFEIFNEENDEENKGKVLHYIGRTHNKKGNIETAIMNYKISLEIYNKNEYKYSIDKAACIIEMGNIYLKLQDYENASKNFKEALRLFEKYNLDPLLKAEPLVYLGLINYQKNELEMAKENLLTGFELLSSRQNPFDILNLFDELFLINEDLAYTHAISIPLGLLWIFSKNNDLIDSNQVISPKFWQVLKVATDKWWGLIFEEKNKILKGIQDEKILLKKIKSKRGRKRKADVRSSEKGSIFIDNWRLKQLIKSTQDPLTNDTIVNMLFGSNDLDTGFSDDYSILRDVQSELEPLWFVEVPVKVNHGEKYLKIRLNNRIKRFSRLIGYPLLSKPFISLKSIKITIETQWLQRFVIDHLFVPNDQWEYESYEINPANAWLSDIYIMDLGDNSKKHTKVELTYKIEFELEATDVDKNPIIVKSTNKRIIIPIYRKNNFQKLEQYIVRNSNSLAIFVASMSFFFSIFDISGQFVNYSELLTQLHVIPFYIISYLIFFGIILSPLYIWGKIKKNSLELEDRIARYGDFASEF